MNTDLSEPAAVPLPVTVVSATRLDAQRFWTQALLGRSLLRFGHETALSHGIKFGNTDGLSQVYNTALAQITDDRILVLVHDDVFIHDHQLVWTLNQAHRYLDVVGIAGNAAPDALHVGWAFFHSAADQPLSWYPREALSGAVSIPGKDGGESSISHYGHAPRRCVLLDGCFLSVRTATMREHGVLFDERFDFHFYDIDFSRTAHEAGLRVGTWPLTLTHAGVSTFDSESWRGELARYRDKWRGRPIGATQDQG